MLNRLADNSRREIGERDAVFEEGREAGARAAIVLGGDEKVIRVTLAVQSCNADGSDASGILGVALEAEP